MSTTTNTADTSTADTSAVEKPGGGVKRSQVGRVVSDKMDRTVTVLLERQVKHALYGKYIKRSTKVKAHDAENSAAEGDKVRIEECRPISRSKSWRVVEIVERAV